VDCSLRLVKQEETRATQVLGKETAMKDPLFEPITINSLTVKNRIYMPAMHLGMARMYEVTDQIVDFYVERARGGAGMICVGFATVDEVSGNPQNIGAHKDDFIPGLHRLSQAIQENGARSVAQLNHAGRYNLSFFLFGKKPVAPSPIPSRLTRETPHELTVEEIHQTIESFAQAALRVKKAGYDAVEVLSGTGYLLSEFLSPLTNQRTDEYGGSLENRMRFGLEIMKAIKSVVGSDYPLMVRMNGNDFMAGGQGRLELQKYARALVEQGVDALCINVGWHEARVPQIVTSVPRGVFAYLSRGIREVVEVPVIASHRINEPAVARKLLTEGMCDMVAMGRSLIADPHLPNKTRNGRDNEIIHCVACAQGCFDHLFKMKHIECLCNPRAGHEGTPLQKADVIKKVMVIGGGPAGMSAALAASERGHVVTLYEKGARLGGQLYLAAAPPGREEFRLVAQDLAHQIARSEVTVKLNTAVDAALLEAEKPDEVVLATGARPLQPAIPGIDQPHVVDAWDVLLDKVSTGTRVIVVGGGAVGVETALFLAEKGTLSGEALKFLLINKAEEPDVLFELATRGTKEVTVLEMVDKVGQDIGKTTRWGILQDLSRYGVTTLTNAKALGITPTGVTIVQDNEESEFPADTVVLAVGAHSDQSLVEHLKALNIHFTVVGDAKKVATAFDAVHAGFKAGRSI